MADALFPPDPDFPDDPDQAAELQERLDRLEALTTKHWAWLRPLLNLARVLHRQLWHQPVSSPLLAEVSQITGLEDAHVQRLLAAAELRLYLRELLLRGPWLYAYAALARHLLDTALGHHTLRIILTDEETPTPDAAAIAALHTSYSALLEEWQQELGELVATQADDPAASRHDQQLLDWQLAGLVQRLQAQPDLLIPLLLETDPVWPPLPDPEATQAPFEFVLPATHLTILSLGLIYLLLVIFKSTSAWSPTLRARLPEQTLHRLRLMLQAFGQVPTGQGLPLRLDLPAAAELHLTSHLIGVLAASATWDEMNHFVNSQQDISPVFIGELPPGIELAEPSSEPPTMRTVIALVASQLLGRLEAFFGADTPALAANRALASQLAELP